MQDELRLTAVALRRHHHAPRDRVGHLGAELLTQQVQARVQPGGRAGARDDAAVLHVEHVGVDVDRGVHLGHRVRVHPVRRRAAPVQHAGGGEDERPAADAQQPCSAGGRVPDDVEHARVGASPPLARSRRDDHEVGLVGEGQVVVDVEREAELGLHDPGIRGHDAEVEVRDAVIRAIEAESLARDAELEGRESVLDDHGDGLHSELLGSSRPKLPPWQSWQFSCDVCPSCHSWQDHVKRSVSAMLMMIVLAALAATAIGASVVALTNDGYHRVPTEPLPAASPDPLALCGETTPSVPPQAPGQARGAGVDLDHRRRARRLAEPLADRRVGRRARAGRDVGGRRAQRVGESAEVEASATGQ